MKINLLTGSRGGLLFEYCHVDHGDGKDKKKSTNVFELVSQNGDFDTNRLKVDLRCLQIAFTTFTVERMLHLFMLQRYHSFLRKNPAGEGLSLPFFIAEPSKSISVFGCGCREGGRIWQEEP